MSHRMAPLTIDGITVLVEVEELPGSKPTSVSAGFNRVEELFDQAKVVIEKVGRLALDSGKSLASSAVRPSQIELQFGIKFAAQGNLIIARGSSEASLAVKVLYENIQIAADEGSTPLSVGERDATNG